MEQSAEAKYKCASDCIAIDWFTQIDALVMKKNKIH